MLSVNTIPTTIFRFTESLPFVNFDFGRLTRPGFHADAALHSAYAEFAERYGNWVDSHFDEHFLAHGGAAILSDFAGGRINRHEAAARLAHAWDSQMGPVRNVVRKRRMVDAAMAADSLLGWYETALRGAA